tara:strand:- start:345 stop:2087 length:1743 start_codon:yes stop_codon:yes gene_type:complete
MGAYDNPRMINDPRAAASANVGVMIGNTLAGVGKRYSEMRRRQADEIEKNTNTIQKKQNDIDNIFNAYVVDMGKQLKNKDITQEMYNKAIENQTTLFQGIGEPGDADYKMGANDAMFLRDTSKNLSRDQRTEYNKIIQTAIGNIDSVVKEIGVVGAESTVYRDYMKTSMTDSNQTLAGFSLADEFITVLTGNAMINKANPDVNTEYDTIDGAKIFTHTISKNSNVLDGIDFKNISKDLIDVDYKETDDNYIITQTLGKNFELVVPVAPAINIQQTGKEIDVLGDDGEIRKDLLYKFKQVNTFPTMDGEVVSSRINGYETEYYPGDYISEKASGKANAQASAVINTGNAGQINGYFNNRFGVNIRDFYADFFNGKTKSEQIEIAENYEQERLDNGFRQNFGDERRLTDSEVAQLLEGKQKGVKHLQSIPDPNTAEYKAWREKDHYLKTTNLGFQGNDTSNVPPSSYEQWLNTSKKWYNSDVFGTGDDTQYYIPSVGTIEKKRSGSDETYMAYQPGSNEEFANVIYSDPSNSNIPKQRIIQTGENTWIAQKMVGDKTFSYYKDVGTPKPKNHPSFKKFLGIN